MKLIRLVQGALEGIWEDPSFDDADKIVQTVVFGMIIGVPIVCVLFLVVGLLRLL